MKTLILILAILFITFNISAQKVNSSDVPLEVRTTFAEMYPGAPNVTWELVNGNYAAGFKETGVETSALFLPAGSFVQTETKILVTSLPAGANDYASKNFPGNDISAAKRIIDANGTIRYQAKIGKSNYLFDADGIYISRATDK